MPFCRPAPTIAAASFVCLATLVGCQESDLETFDQMNRNGTFSGALPDAHGRFETRIWNMNDGTEKVTHHLVDRENRIDTEVILEDGLEIDRDVIVDAWGEFTREGALVIDSMDIVEYPPQPLIDPETRPPRRIATILVQWEGVQHPNNGNGAARERMYLADDSTNVFYAENSYGIETMAGDVFGPYTIADPGGCNVGQIQFLGEDAMIEHGHNPDQYTQHMFYFPGIGGCGFAGLASVGSPDGPATNSWYNGSFGCVTRNQELGHNYGMQHSRRYNNCSDGAGGTVPLTDPVDDCGDVEYGNPYDPMGAGCGHVNIAQKLFMSWVDECNVVTVTNNGTFNLNAAELPCNGPQGIRFETFDGRYYYLEYRTPRGHFNGSISPGIMVVVSGMGGGSPRTYMLEFGNDDWMTPGDGAFTDPGGGVTFEVLELNDDHAVIDVQFENPSGQDPTCLDGSSPGMEMGNWGTLECEPEPYDGDMSPPEITLTFPEDEAWFEPGSDFTITADVTDDRMIIDVELYLDGEKLFRITEPPWEWDVTNIPEGDYEFGAIARDSRHYTPSNAIRVHIGDMPEEEPETTGPMTTGVPGTDGDGDDDAGDDEGDDETGDTSDEEIVGDDKGCACRQSGNQGAPAFALLLFGLGWARRRRRA